MRPADVEVDGFITVFPSSDPHNANGPTLLIHMRPGQNQPRPGRDDWTVDDLIAYSKICTHAGCPVGLYQAQSGLLLCPCHQSTFEVADGRAADLRPGDPLAAAAAARDRRRRLPDRHR